MPENLGKPFMKCQAIKKDHLRCSRTVSVGQQVCWQHAEGWLAKWRALTRNQALAFCLTVCSVLATMIFGIIPILRSAGKPPIVHVGSSGTQSPNVVNNSGSVTINKEQPSGDETKKGKQPSRSKQ